MCVFFSIIFFICGGNRTQKKRSVRSRSSSLELFLFHFLFNIISLFYRSRFTVYCLVFLFFVIELNDLFVLWMLLLLLLCCDRRGAPEGNWATLKGWLTYGLFLKVFFSFQSGEHQLGWSKVFEAPFWFNFYTFCYIYSYIFIQKAQKKSRASYRKCNNW